MDTQRVEAHTSHEHENHARQHGAHTADHGAGHAAHVEHTGHGVDHTGHEQMFRDRFWVNLVLTIPVLLFSPMLQEWLGFSMPGFLGKLWAPVVVWSLIRRCCWVLGIGECPEKPRAAWGRTAKAINEILMHCETEETIVLVSHGWFLFLLALHLRGRRLIERGPLIPKTGYGAMTEYHLRSESAAARVD